MVTVRPVACPHRFVRFTAQPDGSALIESVGNDGKLTSAERASLRELGFEPPTRRVRERNWRMVRADVSLPGIVMVMTVVLQRVHGVAVGDRLEILTGGR